MGLETTNVITGLNETYPTTADAIQQGDDHIRLVKAVLKNCFPNVNAPLTASMVPNVPAGGIAATTLQAAINELDSEKVPLDGTGATGTWGISISGNANTATTATNATNASAIADGAVSTTAKLANSIVTNAKLARAGTAGQVLYSAGAGGDPYWGAPPTSGVTSVNGATGAVSGLASAGTGFDWVLVWSGSSASNIDLIANWGIGIYFCIGQAGLCSIIANGTSSNYVNPLGGTTGVNTARGPAGSESYKLTTIYKLSKV